MSSNLIELIGRENLWIVLSEVAAYLEISPRDIVLFDLWKVGVWVQRRHALATVVSYRQLNCWIPAIRAAIANSPELSHLDELRTALQAEFEKWTDVYPWEIRDGLRRLVQARQGQLEAEKAPRWKAEILMHGNLMMIERCKTQAELDWLWQEMLKQHLYLKRYPNCTQNLEQAAKKHAEYLRRSGSA